MRSRLNRRQFLLAAPWAVLGLAGCDLQPDMKAWGFWSWAEGLNKTLSAPFAHVPAKTYPASAITKDFPVRSLTLADTYGDTLPQWKLTVDGLVPAPRTYTLAEFKHAFPRVAEVTRHDCVEGWSAIAEWSGARLADFVAAMKPHPEAKYVVFHSADFDDDTKAPFYGSLSMQDATHPQTLLAYEMNGQPLPLEHGAPLRLKVPNQLGYKSTKFIHRISFVATLDGLGEGKGGYWEDSGYEYWAGV